MISRASWFACILTATLGIGAAVAATSPDTGPDAATAASLKFNAELVDELAKAGPRSRALASTLLPFTGDASSAPSDLLAEAAQRAPDDVLVQWLAALYAPPEAMLSSSARALLRLEPGNGAAWMFVLQSAAKANDADGVTAALRQIGAAARFDTHFAEFALAWEAIFRAYPAPMPTDRTAGFHLEEQPLIQGIARTSAIAMPAFEPMVRACTPGEAPLAAERREACIAAGRLMVGLCAEQISCALGAAMLRNADAPDYETARRTYDYVQQMYVAVSESLQIDEAAYRRFASDWRETRRESAVIGRMLRRAGLPMTPPADWKPMPTDCIGCEPSVGR